MDDRASEDAYEDEAVGAFQYNEPAPGIDRLRFLGRNRPSVAAQRQRAREERHRRAREEAEPTLDAEVCAQPLLEDEAPGEEPELTWWERRRLRVTVAGVLGLVAIAAITAALVTPQKEVVEVRTPVPSRAPTAASRDQDDPEVQAHLGKLLAPVTPGGWNQLRNVSSAYHRAWLWLANEDRLPKGTTNYWANLHQRYVLMAVHFFGGPADTEARSGVHECEWPGVVCQDIKEWDRKFALGRADGIQINLPVRMAYRLNLSRRNVIDGEVSPAISLLYYLQHLDAVGLGLGGRLPAPLYELASLKSLVLEGNVLTNVDAIGGFQYLEQLSLARNNFQGPIPGSIKDLTMLRELRLHANQFTGTVSDILQGLKYLEVLLLGDNKFDSKILTQPCISGNLSTLTLNNNALDGTLPTEFGQCTNLVHLDLGNNDLRGPLPSELGKLAHLRELNLFSNRFDSIPSTLNNLTALVNFDISQNGVEGPIPDSVVQLTQLIRLDLSVNAFTGTIPSAFANLTLLESFFLQKNYLFGTMPQAVCKLRKNKLNHLVADCNIGKNGKVKCEKPTCCTSCGV